MATSEALEYRMRLLCPVLSVEKKQLRGSVTRLVLFASSIALKGWPRQVYGRVFPTMAAPVCVKRINDIDAFNNGLHCIGLPVGNHAGLKISRNMLEG
ncbi:hypothetical protein VTP01DRAFT_9035 [Rhizomucor pusillus]|uniref:uncharacterized protein n=1 Tax=Rhizomucor pusillus TaxID=4840 RepID=UPI003743AF2E